MVSPKISNALLKIGLDETVNGVLVHHPQVLGLQGWQWIYIFWGFPAVILGVIVLVFLKDHPRDAAWLTPEERQALEDQLALEKAKRTSKRRLTLGEGLGHPKVVILAAAYFFCVTANSHIAVSVSRIWQG